MMRHALGGAMGGLVLLGLGGGGSGIAAGAAAVAAPLRPTPHVPVPGVVYLEEIGEAPLELATVEDVWVQVTPDPRTRVDLLAKGRQARVLGLGERFCWIQARAARGPVVGWVPTASLQPVPPEIWESLLAKQQRLEQQQRLVEEGRIAVGMTMDQVREAFGRPDETEMEVTAAAETVRWYYHEFERQHVYLPGAYVAGMAVAGGYWATQRLILASLIVTFVDGTVGRIERKVFRSPERFAAYETWAPYGLGGGYGFVSRWPTRVIGNAVSVVPGQVPSPAARPGVERPAARGGERVERLFGSGVELIQPQPGQPMSTLGPTAPGSPVPQLRTTRPAGERAGGERAAGQGTVTPAPRGVQFIQP